MWRMGYGAGGVGGGEKLRVWGPRPEVAWGSLAIPHPANSDLAPPRRYYERLIEVNPGRSQYHGRLAHVLGQQGDIRRAIVAAEKCLELNPSLAQSHAWLAEVYRTLGNPERAGLHDAKLKQFQSSSR